VVLLTQREDISSDFAVDKLHGYIYMTGKVFS